MVKRIKYSGVVMGVIILVILRILGNDKGRLSPDSIRYIGQAWAFPEINNTTAPLGYPWLISLGELFGMEYFWFSKIVALGILLGFLFFCYKKQFFGKEILLTCTFISSVSVISATLSEFTFIGALGVFYYYLNKFLLKKESKLVDILVLSVLILVLFMVRYAALFTWSPLILLPLVFKLSKAKVRYLMATVFLSLLWMISYVLIVTQFAPIQKSHYELKTNVLEMTWEFIRGLFTEFNPFSHMYFEGFYILQIPVLLFGLGVFLFLIKKLRNAQWEKKESIILFLSVLGMIQLFLSAFIYSMDEMNYRLLIPYTFFIWVVVFSQLIKKYHKFYFPFIGLNFMVIIAFILITFTPFIENYKAVKSYFKDKDLHTIDYQYDTKNVTDIDVLVLSLYPQLKYGEKPTGKDRILLTHQDLEDKLNMKDNFVKIK